MRRLLINLMVAITILFGSAHSAALAHTHLGDTSHAVEIVDNDHHTNEIADDVGHSSPTTDRDIAQHHHCSAGLAHEALVVRGQALAAKTNPTPALEAAMLSLPTAPPTEPPSA